MTPRNPCRGTVGALLAVLFLGCLSAQSGEDAGRDEKPEERRGEMAVADDPVLEKLIGQARADLAERLSIPEDDVEVARAERVTWRDSSLGCPEEGMFYMQMLTPGVLIELRASGETYPYHGNLEGPPAYCESPSAAGPLPADAG